MKKTIKITDVILFSIAGVIDLFEEMKDSGNLFSNYYQNLYGFVPKNWKKQNLVKLLSTCYQNKLISRTKKNKKTFFDLTVSGKNHIYKRFPQIFWQKEHWNNRWYIVFFDIQEINRHLRDNLRNTLKQTGFSMIQKSVWITPSVKSSIFIKNWIDQNHASEKIILIEANKIPFTYEKHLIQKIWNLKDTNIKIKAIFDVLKNIKNRLTDTTDVKKEFDTIYSQLIEISIGIPSLPKKFYPQDWVYDQTWNLAKKLKEHFIKNSTFEAER